MQVDGFAQLAMLPLRVDAVGVLHLAPGEVFEPLIAVEAAAILAELSEPGPHLLDRCLDRHGVEDLHPAFGQKLVPRQLARLVLRFGAPTQAPGPDRQRIQRRRGRAEERPRRGQAEGEDGTGDPSDASRRGRAESDRRAEHHPEGAHSLQRPERARLDKAAFHATPSLVRVVLSRAPCRFQQ